MVQKRPTPTHPRFLILLAALTTVAALSEPAFSKPKLRLTLLESEGGSSEQRGQFIGKRIRFTVRTLRGDLITRDFILSSEALAEYSQTAQAIGRLGDFATRSYRFGQLDMIHRPTHLGLGFSGISFSKDRDRGIDDLVRTGLYGIISLIQTEHARFSLRSGYEAEDQRINRQELPINHKLPQIARFSWQSRHFDALTQITWAMQSATNFEIKKAAWRSDAQAHVKIITLADLRLGLGGHVWYEKNPFHELYGIFATHKAAEFFISVGWDSAPKHKKKRRYELTE